MRHFDGTLAVKDVERSLYCFEATKGWPGGQGSGLAFAPRGNEESPALRITTESFIVVEAFVATDGDGVAHDRTYERAAAAQRNCRVRGIDGADERSVAVLR